MSLETRSIKNNRSIDEQWITENEEKEFRNAYQNNNNTIEEMGKQAAEIRSVLESMLSKEERYDLAVKSLVEKKLKEGTLSEIDIDIELLDLNLNNIEATKEQLESDVDKKVLELQNSKETIKEINTSKNTSLEEAIGKDLEQQIEYLKNDLNWVFDNDGNDKNQPEVNDEKKGFTNIVAGPKNAKVKKEESKNINDLPVKAKENIKEYIEHMTQMPTKISKIDKIYKEGPYYVVDATDDKGRFIGAEFTEEDFLKIANSSIKDKEVQNSNQFDVVDSVSEEKQKTNQEDMVKNILLRTPLGTRDSVINDVISDGNNRYWARVNGPGNSFSKLTEISEDEYNILKFKIEEQPTINSKPTQSETNEKSVLISKIMNSMSPEELQYIPMPDLKARMEQMSNEKLQQILSQYENQNQELDPEQTKKL